MRVLYDGINRDVIGESKCGFYYIVDNLIVESNSKVAIPKSECTVLPEWKDVTYECTIGNAISSSELSRLSIIHNRGNFMKTDVFHPNNIKNYQVTLNPFSVKEKVD